MSSTIDFFSALDVDDDVNELLELQRRPPPSASPSAVQAAAINNNSNNNNLVASSSARDLLTRMQLAQSQVLQQQQQQHRVASSSARAASTNLVDGLMHDDMNSDPSDLFGDDALMMGSPDNPTFGGLSSLMMPPSAVPSRPFSGIASMSAAGSAAAASSMHRHHHHHAPTMADLAADEPPAPWPRRPPREDHRASAAAPLRCSAPASTRHRQHRPFRRFRPT